MFRKILFLSFCSLITLSASAQWWKLKPAKRLPVVERLPLLPEAQCLPFTAVSTLSFVPALFVAPVQLSHTQYTSDVAEASILKSLRHSLHYHMNSESIKGFHDLAALYLEQNRYSEAKWYLLQSNYIGRQQKDNPEIIASLMDLGMLKAEIGEFEQARQDMLEAQDVARSKGLLSYLDKIEKNLVMITGKQLANVKNEVKYAAEVMDDKSGQ